MMHSRHFLLEEAQNELKKIEQKVRRMVSLKTTIDEKSYNLYRHHFFTGGPDNGEKYYPEVLELISILKECLKRGVLVKGIDNGLADFPCIRQNGEEVNLCWKLGEEEILYGHHINNGFAGRKPVLTL
ncbi:DUF2203 domain-containing protein [candidate division KSB1 bacterium]